MKIIAISGLIGSGKDTVANYLISKYNFKRESLAKSLKDATANIFGWDREMLEGSTSQSRTWRETRDEWWSDKLRDTFPEGVSPRYVLQLLGTEVFRNNFHNDIWVLSLEKRLSINTDNIVITDCRFPNEIQMIKSLGGKTIWIRRGNLPEWYDMALEVNTTSPELLPEFKRMYNIHDSEYKWIGTNFDYVLYNDTTLDELNLQIDNFMKTVV